MVPSLTNCSNDRARALPGAAGEKPFDTEAFYGPLFH